MTITQLRCFIALAGRLHFSRTADMLHISQPSLSYQISSLEDELDMKLFDRSTRKLTITPAGRALLAEAQELITRFDALGSSVRDPGAPKPPPRFTVAVDPAAFYYNARRHAAFVNALQNIQTAFPNMRVTFLFAPSVDCVQHMRMGRCDICVGLSEMPVAGVQWTEEPLPIAPLMLIAHESLADPDPERQWEKVAAFSKEKMLFHFGLGQRLITEVCRWFESRGMEVHPEQAADPMLPIICAEMNIGLCVAPVNARHEFELKNCITIPLPEDIGLRHYIRAPMTDPNPLAQIFTDDFLSALAGPAAGKQ